MPYIHFTGEQKRQANQVDLVEFLPFGGYTSRSQEKKKRPLGIPCMYDQALQTLYALALDPVAETTADAKSFGFRKGRCAQDTCEHIFSALSHKTEPQWLLEGDIKGCFDHISHQWLIENVPMDKSVLKQFLKAGFIFRDELFPTDEGTPPGGRSWSRSFKTHFS